MPSRAFLDKGVGVTGLATAHPTPVPQQPQPLTRSTTTRSASRRERFPSRAHGRRSREPNRPATGPPALPAGNTRMPHTHGLATNAFASRRDWFPSSRLTVSATAHAACLDKGLGVKGCSADDIHPPPTRSTNTNQRVTPNLSVGLVTGTTHAKSTTQRVPARGSRTTRSLGQRA